MSHQLGIDWSPKRASVEALEALPLKTVREDHKRILDALRSGPKTDEEIQAVTGLSPNSERPRRGELVSSGRVTACAEPGRSASGRRATRWRLA